MCFETLELKGITHSYHRELDDSHFMVGPIDLVFHPGELVFLVGGNGSGKSTLAKLITACIHLSPVKFALMAGL